jgi:hypothetical protein
LADAARWVLLYPNASVGARGEIRQVLDDCLAGPVPMPLSDAEVLTQARRWLDASVLEDGERLLRTLAGRTPTPAGLPEAWLQLVHKHGEHNDRASAKRVCAYILENFPGTTAAQKAQFLLAAEAS